ncbi:MAG: hypothetical protein ACHP79_06055 [Terriglobales bacterium]
MNTDDTDQGIAKIAEIEKPKPLTHGGTEEAEEPLPLKIATKLQ